MQETIEQVIANIRGRNIELSIKDGDRIITSAPLLPEEKEALREHRAEAVALISATSTMPETVEQAYQRGLEEGRKELEGARAESYALGIQHAIEEFQTRPPVAAPVAQVLRTTTPDEEIVNLERWLAGKSDYYGPWEPEVIEALRAALVPGEKIVPMFAYSCAIIGADRKEREFKRVPNKRKAV